VFLAPFLVWGMGTHRRDAAFRPWLVYGATLFAFSALLFAVHVDHGTFLHSAVALVPHAYLLAMAGIGAAVRWVAARRPHWDPPRATRNFTVAVVVVAILGAVGATLRTSSAWRGEQQTRAPIVAALRAAPAADHVMSPDPGSYRYLSGRGGVITPNDPLPVVEEVLRAYDIRWLVLEKGYILPALVPLLTGETRPAWLSAPVVAVPAVPDPAGPPPGMDARLVAAPAATLFAVCFDSADGRCAP
jgi:hypothetical protein